MGRRLRANLLQMPEQLKPDWPYLKVFCEQDCLFKTKQKHNFDKRHKGCPLSVIPDGSNVWITDIDYPIPAVVTTQAETPRSYMVDTEKGQDRRNRYHLRVVPHNSDVEKETVARSSEPTETEMNEDTSTSPSS